jgi:hypothetical protein
MQFMEGDISMMQYSTYWSFPATYVHYDQAEKLGLEQRRKAVQGPFSLFVIEIQAWQLTRQIQEGIYHITNRQ